MVNAADEGGFPGSRWADNDEDFPATHCERHTIQHLKVVKPFLDVHCFDYNFACLARRDAD